MSVTNDFRSDFNKLFYIFYQTHEIQEDTTKFPFKTISIDVYVYIFLITGIFLAALLIYTRYPPNYPFGVVLKANKRFSRFILRLLQRIDNILCAMKLNIVYIIPYVWHCLIIREFNLIFCSISRFFRLILKRKSNFRKYEINVCNFSNEVLSKQLTNKYLQFDPCQKKACVKLNTAE